MVFKTELITRNGLPVLHTFSRTQDGELHIEPIYNFKFWFYVDENCPLENFENVYNTESGYVSIENTKLKKVYVNNYYKTRELKDKIESLGYSTWEADIPMINRYFMSMDKDPEKEQLKVCFFDIETAPETTFDEGEDVSVQEFPEPDKAEQCICSICASVGNNMYQWLCGPVNVKGTRYFFDEKDMLEDFIHVLKEENPDIISAYNLDNFDAPYLINRCKKLGINYHMLSRLNSVTDRFAGNKTVYNFKGTILFDLFVGYKLWRKYGNMTVLASYSLDYVARTILNDNKLEHGKTISYLWKHDPKTLVEYNTHDVVLMKKLDEKCKIVDFFDNARRMSRIQFEDVYKTTSLIDGYLISRLKESIILPNSKPGSSGNAYSGAFVFEPVPGIYKNVLCQDIASMYPSIIKTYNISYETVGGNDIILPYKNLGFSKTPGIIPKFLDELGSRRKEAKQQLKIAKKENDIDKEEFYYQRQYSLKIILNSLYGYLGFPGSRLYKPVVAESVTGMGQLIIKMLASKCIEYGVKVIYSDTDSIYVESTHENPFKAVEQGADLENFLNRELSSYNDAIVGKNYIYMEFEKALNVVLFVDAKKRYAYQLLWEADKKFNVDSDIHATGFDYIRSDSSILAKRCQKTVIEMILKNTPKEEVMLYLKNQYQQLVTNKIPTHELGFPKAINAPLDSYNPPQAHIKAAIYSNKHLHTHYRNGSKPKMVYINSYNGSVPSVFANNKHYQLEAMVFEQELPSGFKLDYDKMSDITFKKKLEKIFNAIGWGWEPLNNTGLSSFFK